MGDGRVHYVVGSGYEQRNPVSGLPAFADNQGWFGKAKSWVAKKAKNVTQWHFEDRDKLNAPLPDNAKDARRDGFVRYPDWMSEYHNNGHGRPEAKYAHPDGREVIFDGNTGEVVTDPKLKGTYNYVHQALPGKSPEDWQSVGDGFSEIVQWSKAAASGLGHIVKDVAPYRALGSKRKVK